MEHVHSSSLGALAKALAAAQTKLRDAKKDATNPHFKNRYATLSSVRDAISAILPEHGIAYVQTFEPHGDAGVCVVTTLLHESGEWISSRLYLPVSKKDAQGFGSAISYGRRYALAAIVGIAADDDDGEEAARPLREVPKAPGSAPQIGPSLQNWEASATKALEGAETMGDLTEQWAGVVKFSKKLNAPADVLKRLAVIKDAAKTKLSGAA